MTILLIYTAIFVPFKTAFIDDTSLNMIIFETLIDVLFIADLFINFLSAYEDNSGLI